MLTIIVKILKNIFATLVFLCCCHTSIAAKYKPLLSESELSSIQSLKVISYVPQNKIAAQYRPAQGGSVVTTDMALAAVSIATSMIVSSVDNHRAQIARSKVQPYQTMLNDYSVTDLIHSGLKKHLQQSGFNITEFIEVNEYDASIRKKYLASNDLSKEKILFVHSTYSLGLNAEVLHVFADAALYISAKPKSPGSKVMRYKKRDFSVLWQSPAQAIHWVLAEEGYRAELLENTKHKYQVKMDKERDRVQKDILKTKMKRRIKDLSKAKALKLKETIVKEEWLKPDVIGYLENGFRHVFANISDMLTKSISKQVFSDAKLVYPYGVAGKHDVEDLLELVPLAQQDNKDYKVYHSKKNSRYIIPQDELIWLPLRTLAE